MRQFVEQHAAVTQKMGSRRKRNEQRQAGKGKQERLRRQAGQMRRDARQQPHPLIGRSGKLKHTSCYGKGDDDPARVESQHISAPEGKGQAESCDDVQTQECADR